MSTSPTAVEARSSAHDNHVLAPPVLYALDYFGAGAHCLCFTSCTYVLWFRVRWDFHVRETLGLIWICNLPSGQEVVCPASKEIIIITVCSVIGQQFLPLSCDSSHDTFSGGISLIIGFAVLFYRWKKGPRSLSRNQDMKELELRRELLHSMEQVWSPVGQLPNFATIDWWFPSAGPPYVQCCTLQTMMKFFKIIIKGLRYLLLCYDDNTTSLFGYVLQLDHSLHFAVALPWA